MAAQSLILLHGALGSSREWDQLKTMLPSEMQVFSPDFPGHAGNPMPEAELSLGSLCSFLADYIENHIPSGPVVVIGHSLGGYVALKTALDGNSRIAGIVTLGTKLFWSPEIARRESGMLQHKLLLEKVPKYAAALSLLHGEDHWISLLDQISALLHELGMTNPLSPDKAAMLSIPVRVMLGDSDQMVSLEETLHFQKALGNSGLSILPNTPHPLTRANPSRLAFEVQDFLSSLRNT